MIERTQSNRPIPRRLRWRLFAPEYRSTAVVAFIIIVIGIVIGGHLYGRYLASIDLAKREAQLEHLCLCNLPIELRGPFRGLCLCPGKLPFPTVEIGVGRDSVRMLSQLIIE